MSWKIWNLLESLDWRFLPDTGGILDQPEWLLDDLATISWRQHRVKDMMDAGAAISNTPNVLNRK